MGVPAIWDILRENDAFDKRVPFAEFVQSWRTHNHTPVRIAIDAYQWLFESRAGITPELETQLPQDVLVSKALQLFMSRTRELIALNVSFVYVFDGCFKPTFKRKLGSSSDEQFLNTQDFEEYQESVRDQLNATNYDTYDSAEVKEVKKMLRAWNITYVEAPADGEAEAARLQKDNVVDYVLSNDTDTLAYGATAMLRNFSKAVDDVPSSSAHRSDSGTQFMVTPLYSTQIQDITGLDADRFTFFSIMMGADYNYGVSKIGAKRAQQLSLCGTRVIKQYVSTFPYDDLEDFSEELKTLYRSHLPKRDRLVKYKKLQDRVNKLVKESPKALFGRNEKLVLNGWAPDFVVSLYFNPTLAPNRFKWKAGSTNVGDSPYDPSTLDINTLFKCLSKGPSNIVYINRFFAREMTQCHLPRHIISIMGETWSNQETVKFEDIRDRKQGALQDRVVRIRHWLLPEFELKGTYIDPDERSKGSLTSIPLGILPEMLQESLDDLQKQRDLLKKSPSKSPKKSPKKRLPRSSKSFTQDQLSPEKLSPRKVKRGEATQLLAPPKLKNLTSELKALDEQNKPTKKSKMFMPSSELLHRYTSSSSFFQPHPLLSASPDKNVTAIDPAVLPPPTSKRQPVAKGSISPTLPPGGFSDAIPPFDDLMSKPSTSLSKSTASLTLPFSKSISNSRNVTQSICTMSASESSHEAPRAAALGSSSSHARPSISAQLSERIEPTSHKRSKSLTFSRLTETDPPVASTSSAAHLWNSSKRANETPPAYNSPPKRLKRRKTDFQSTSTNTDSDDYAYYKTIDPISLSPRSISPGSPHNVKPGPSPLSPRLGGPVLKKVKSDTNTIDFERDGSPRTSFAMGSDDVNNSTKMALQGATSPLMSKTRDQKKHGLLARRMSMDKDDKGHPNWVKNLDIPVKGTPSLTQSLFHRLPNELDNDKINGIDQKKIVIDLTSDKDDGDEPTTTLNTALVKKGIKRSFYGSPAKELIEDLSFGDFGDDDDANEDNDMINSSIQVISNPMKSVKRQLDLHILPTKDVVELVDLDSSFSDGDEDS